MVTTNSTNKNRLPSYRWFLGHKSQRNPQKVHSLVYKDYTLVEYEDGTKYYVSPEEKTQLILKGRFGFSKASLEDEKLRAVISDSESESDSGYEIPTARTPKTEIKKNNSFPFFGGEILPGDNGRINLPPYIVPLETSLTFPMTKQKQKDEKKKKNKKFDAADRETNLESSSPDAVDEKKRFSFKDTFWTKNKKKPSDTDEYPEDVEVKEITKNTEIKRFSMPLTRDNTDYEATGNTKPLKLLKEMKFETEAKVRSDRETENREAVGGSQLEEPVEIFPENLGAEEDGSTKRFSRGFYLPKFPDESLKSRERGFRNKKLDPNSLKKMFRIRGVRKTEGEENASHTAQGPGQESEGARGRYSDAALSQIQSDTESADHGSADKSSVSKLTSEKQSKKLVSGLFGSFRKGRNKERTTDNNVGKNSLSFEISVKEEPEDIGQTGVARAEGIVYAELDMGRSPSSVMRRDDEKTEYAEIIYPGTKPTVERSVEDLRRSRENLTSSRENLTEVDEAFSTMADGKKEAAV